MAEESTLPTSSASDAAPNFSPDIAPDATFAPSIADGQTVQREAIFESGAVAIPTTMSLEDLFTAHADAVYRYVRRRVDANDADDITADVFVTACRRIGDIPDGSELPWLYRTAWNLVSNHWRKQTPLSVAEVHETADEFDNFADLITESAVLRQAWATLSARDREVLRLVAWEGLDGAGLAAALGISVSGAGAAVWRARQHLRSAYEHIEAETPTTAQEPPPPRHTPGGPQRNNQTTEPDSDPEHSDLEGGDR